MIQQLISIIKSFEGLRLTAYTDPVGIWTIGFGSTGNDITENTTWTKEQVDAELFIRATQALNDAVRLSPSLAPYPYRQVAIADFIYNLGLSAYKKSTLKKYIDKEQWQHAKMEILKWNHAGGKVLPGLTRRRAKESTLLGID